VLVTVALVVPLLRQRIFGNGRKNTAPKGN
jgi:hypothetical protein